MSRWSFKNDQARIDFDPSNEIVTGRILGIRDVVGFHARTVDGLKQAFHEAVDDSIETCAKVGRDPLKPYSGRVMFRISPELHVKAAIAAELEGESLNEWAAAARGKAAEQNVV